MTDCFREPYGYIDERGRFVLAGNSFPPGGTWQRLYRDPQPCPHCAEKDARIKRLANLSARIYSELNDDGQWPDHAHSRPGIWDANMGVLANQPCELCALWAEFGKMVQPAE